ncbi:hypothetical protein D3C81_1282290 [compost metagenome]
MAGTPARLFTAIRIRRVTGPWRAYSRRYTAASTPNGVTITAMIRVIITVPKIAGKIPPSVLASRGSSLRNSQTLAKYTPILVKKPMPFGW